MISPLRNRRGGIVGRAIIAHDITHLKQAEEALRHRQDHLEAVVAERTRALREANAQLQREIAERRRAEEELGRYAARMEILHEIDRAILAARSPEEIATAALSRIQDLVPCQRAAIALADWATNELVIMAIKGRGETTWPAGAKSRSRAKWATAAHSESVCR